MPDATHLTAPAKVNLGLEILRRRSDGYHELETVFYRIALADTIELHDRSNGSGMTCDDPALGVGPDNLCLRAVEALRRATSIERGVHVVLHKRIPTGAGLGGGSSNAAAVLMGLNERWSAGLSIERLKEIGATLGSDVAAFLGSPLAFGRGRGEILEDLPPAFPHWLVCVTPPVSVATSWAYGHLQLRSRPDRTSLRERFLHALPDLGALDKMLTNDFEETVLPAYPQIAEAKRRLRAAGCTVALMSGSGSSVFGLTTDRASAEAAARHFDSSFIISVSPPLS
jgi:4-diphosphocytidyl-2-C-methyl-D-erythritol kinase